MSLIGIVVALVILGVALWAIDQLPLDATIKRIVHVVVILVVVLWLLQALGLLAGLRLGL